MQFSGDAALDVLEVFENACGEHIASDHCQDRRADRRFLDDGFDPVRMLGHWVRTDDAVLIDLVRRHLLYTDHDER